MLALLAVVATLVPPVLVARIIVRDAVDVPFWDQWTFAGVVANASRGEIAVRDLWQPNNEHRLLLPRLLMLGLARLSGWDVRWEMWAGFAVALATFALVALLVARTLRPVAPRLVPWLIAVASAQTFSLAQWQNWTWGWQVQIFMNMLAVAGVACALARWGSAWRGLPWILLGVVVAGLSFASGLTLVILVPLALLALDGWAAVDQAGVAAVAGGLLLGIYFVDFHPVGNPSAHVWPWSDPIGFAAYVTSYLGAGFEPDDLDVASAWGIAGLLALAIATIRLWGRSPDDRRALVPWGLLALYAVVAAVLTAFGRLGAGAGTALLSRYTTVTAPFWTSVAVVVAVALRRETARVRNGALVLVVAVFLLAADGYRRVWEVGDSKSALRAAALRQGLFCVSYLDAASDACLTNVCWDPRVLRFFAAPLRTAHLGPFRRRLTPPA